jgi:hypothetical protein
MVAGRTCGRLDPAPLRINLTTNVNSDATNGAVLSAAALRQNEGLAPGVNASRSVETAATAD